MDKDIDASHAGSESATSSYATWIALGAIAAGSVGAIIGMAKRRTSAERTAAFSDETEPESVTPPHGDKLRGAVV